MLTLKEIELTGFKSFGKKCLISLTTPITAVVGPNGSGKSNIVESVRFVLGEQSMKSLRGKGGVDLIFKGSKSLSSASRAVVTIKFDNSQKIFSFTNSGLGIPLDYDEVTISREVYADGANRYIINGTEVRLKDVVDLLASVNIGSSGHHIISQGEADRVLNASNKDRRSMIEDALGLKVYQFRIRESERKLEKTSINIKEVQALRREIAPHLVFLKKQVQIVEKSREMRDELKDLYSIYLSKETTYLEREIKRLNNLHSGLDEKGLSLDERITKIQADKKDDNRENIYTKEIKEQDIILESYRREKDDQARKIGRIEGIQEGINRQIQSILSVKERVISNAEWKTLVTDLEDAIDQALSLGEVTEIEQSLRSMKERLVSFHSQKDDGPRVIDPAILNEQAEMEKERSEIQVIINKIEEDEQNIRAVIDDLKQKEREVQDSFRDSERVLYELLKEKNEVVSSLHSIGYEEEKLALIKNAYEMELTEAGVLIGREVLDFIKINYQGEITRQSQDEIRRKIERIKIKLEDAGTGSGNEVLKEFEDTKERDSFLEKEINDLNQSIESLNTLILELKEKLDKEFKNGVEKINKQFQEFFALMFGGGGAFLSITMEHKKPKKNSDESIEMDGESEDETEEENGIGFERGIEINVTLPQKKVKDLRMLSGGERSLTSIALLFAISQVNPPPFLVLDETDAALDEANSRKYGNMLENLSKYSELIVVTHNRETMSRAQVLYGVTMSAEGSSKLLSIHLEDASTYAK